MTALRVRVFRTEAQHCAAVERSAQRDLLHARLVREAACVAQCACGLPILKRAIGKQVVLTANLRLYCAAGIRRGGIISTKAQYNLPQSGEVKRLLFVTVLANDDLC